MASFDSMKSRGTQSSMTLVQRVDTMHDCVILGGAELPRQNGRERQYGGIFREWWQSILFFVCSEAGNESSLRDVTSYRAIAFS